MELIDITKKYNNDPELGSFTHLHFYPADEPTSEDAISILRGIKEKYEVHHKVRIKDEAVIAAVELSQRYITNRFLPDKAIDILDEVGARVHLKNIHVPKHITGRSFRRPPATYGAQVT